MIKKKVLLTLLVALLVGNLFFIISAQEQKQTFLKTFSEEGTSLKITFPNIEKAVVSYEEKPESYQFNITLLEQPKSNSFQVQLETDGLRFYYQPPLNEELDNRDYDLLNETHAVRKGQVVNYRPENVVGSYAVYKENVGSGETGKLYHIYRPLVVDAKGSWVWAKLNVTKTLLSITVDADWLAKAVYPVVIDPEFGYTSIGASAYNDWASGVYACVFEAPESGTVSKLSAYVYTASTGDVNGGSYDDNAGTPNNLLDEGTAYSITAYTYAWYNWTLDYAVTGGSDYWFATVATSVNYYVKYDAGGTGQTKTDTVESGFPDPWDTTSATLDYKLSMFATYTASGGGEESVSLELNTPANDSTVSSYTQNFNYTPTLVGSDSFHNATLYLNGTACAYNATVIENATLNTISYVLSGQNASYFWDILLWNSTQAVFSTNGNFTLIVAVSEGGDLTATDEEHLALAIVAVSVSCTVFGAVVFQRKKRNGKTAA